MVLHHLVEQVYQSLDRELQKHVNHQDILQQCQTWLTAVQEELQLNDQGPSGLQEALKQVTDSTHSSWNAVMVIKYFSNIYFASLLSQVKHYRALQEQASTYLDLVCSVCDLSDDAVRVAAAQVQQIKLTVSNYYLLVHCTKCATDFNVPMSFGCPSACYRENYGSFFCFISSKSFTNFVNS